MFWSMGLIKFNQRLFQPTKATRLRQEEDKIKQAY
jgi:hypothetical protein